MISVDTNVLVRLLANDDPQQSPRAARLFAAENVFVPKSVLLETEWVLRFSYKMNPSAIHLAFTKILATASVTVEDVASVGRAAAWYGGGMDFADALHLASSSTATKFVTFDRNLRAAAAASKTTPPVELGS